MNMDFKSAIDGIKQNTCPECSTSLDYDVQADSIYSSCSCGEFEISAFRDKFNGSLMLYYLNNDVGGVEKDNLKKLQEVLYRNKSIKKQIFTLNIKNRIF